MPFKKICRHAGCLQLVEHGESYCKQHKSKEATRKSERQRQYDQSVRLERDAREHAFYISAGWKTMQKRIMSIYSGLCLWSYYKNESIESADEVHHIEPIKERWDLRLDPDNLVPLSHREHMRIEKRMHSGDMRVKSELQELKRRWNVDFRGGRGL
ncbi:HNH endonuclease signature motif containing protein [Anaeromassilibacillus senegalensis]|uniref:HNH endonuclease signature motif containing protein n=1 Tax=Anaeromassilibacillus senegalensis TaxID=1673717 RepID=UPI0006821C80|nr:HNH endonuclease [Anaeromassilibacillus senegalensis]